MNNSLESLIERITKNIEESRYNQYRVSDEIEKLSLPDPEIRKGEGGESTHDKNFYEKLLDVLRLSEDVLKQSTSNVSNLRQAISGIEVEDECR